MGITLKQPSAFKEAFEYKVGKEFEIVVSNRILNTDLVSFY